MHVLPFLAMDVFREIFILFFSSFFFFTKALVVTFDVFWTLLNFVKMFEFLQDCDGALNTKTFECKLAERLLL